MAEKCEEDEVPDYIKKIREKTEKLRKRRIKKYWAPRTVQLVRSRPENAQRSED